MFGPCVLEPHRLVEYRMVCSAVGVGHEVSDALELQILTGFLVGSVLFYIATGADSQRVGVEQFMEVALIGRRVLYKEETVILSYLGSVVVCGLVLGISIKVVTPPATAARLSLSMSPL